MGHTHCRNDTFLYTNTSIKIHRNFTYNVQKREIIAQKRESKGLCKEDPSWYIYMYGVYRLANKVNE